MVMAYVLRGARWRMILERWPQLLRTRCQLILIGFYGQQSTARPAG